MQMVIAKRVPDSDYLLFLAKLLKSKKVFQ